MEFIQELMTIENAIALVTLIGLEIILGIDNIVFLTIVVEKLPEAKRGIGRRVGLLLAMVIRIGLLFVVSWVMRLDQALFHLMKHGVSTHDLVLIVGGGFLIAKATLEIHGKLAEISGVCDESAEHHETSTDTTTKTISFWGVIAEILALDMIFSLDSVITAVGMADSIAVIITAVIVAVLVMMIFAELVGRFVANNPTIKMLALSFLILIGVALVGEGFSIHLPKGYIYTAMGFSLAVELVNLKVIQGMMRKRRKHRKQG